MSDIQRYDYDKVWGMEKHELGDYVDYDDHKAIVAQLETHLAEAKKDQARYQWIRQAGAWESEVGLDLLSGRPELFDEAVDAELALIKDQSNG